MLTDDHNFKITLVDENYNTVVKMGSNTTQVFESGILTFGEANRDLVLNAQRTANIKFWSEFMDIVTDGEYDMTIGFPVWVEYLNDTITDAQIAGQMAWKQKHIVKNMEMYEANKEALDAFFDRNREYIQNATPTELKFEWQAGKSVNDFSETLIQFRPSGLRCKRPTEVPTLVAMVQTSIIFDRDLNAYRELSLRELARLQSFSKDFIFDDNDFQAAKQFGNAVNAKCVTTMLRSMEFSYNKHQSK